MTQGRQFGEWERAAASLPPALSSADYPDRVLRYLAIRTCCAISTQQELARIALGIESQLLVVLRKAYVGIDESRLEKAAGRVALWRIDDLHLIARLEHASRSDQIGDDDLVMISSLLLQLDELFHIDDMQGTPRMFWRLFLPPKRVGCGSASTPEG